MSSENFSVSADFEMFEAKSESALEKAKNADRRVMGMPLPIGLQGRACILAMSADKSKEKDDGKGNKTGGNPMVVVTIGINSPDQYKGHKQPLYFSFYDSKGMSYDERYQMFLDFMEGCGMPKEVRKGKMGEIFKWASQEPREFPFEVVANRYGTDGKEIRPLVGAAPSALPGATSTSAAMGAQKPVFTVEQDVTFAGKHCKIKSVNGSDKYNIVFVESNREMADVDASDIKPGIPS